MRAQRFEVVSGVESGVGVDFCHSIDQFIILTETTIRCETILSHKIKIK